MPAHFYAITDDQADRHILRIRTSNDLQQELGTLFIEQAAALLACDRVPFQPSDAVDDDEVFEIAGFPMPDDIRRAATVPHEFDELHLTENTALKSIFCTLVNGNDIRVFFQSFMPQRLLSRRRTIFFSGETYQSLTSPGLVLDHKLSAIFTNHNLVFRSYHTVSRFLDLTFYFEEASDGDIANVVSHQLFSPTHAPAVIALSNATLRRKFMALRKSGVLDHVTSAAVQAAAHKYNLPLQVAGNRIVFPGNRQEVRRLLTLLNEGYFQGEFTGQHYMTNWQRPVG